MTDQQAPRRYGVVGAGNQAHYRIPSLLDLRHEGFEVVAICDLATDRANDVARKFGIPSVYRTMTDMIAAEELDGVVIMSPHAYHAEQAIEAMEAGLDVFVEKPMAISLADCRRMLEVARAKGVILAVGYQYAYWAGWLREQVRSGIVGAVVGATLRWSRAAGIPAPPSFWDDPIAGGVPLDVCGHLISQLKDLIPGHPVSVQAVGSREAGVRRFGEAFVSDDTIDAVIVFSGGERVKIAPATWEDGGPPVEENTADVFGTEGELNHHYPCGRKDVDALRPVVRRYGDGGFTRLGPTPRVYHDVVVEQAADWHRACQNRTQPRFTAEDAYEVELVVHAIRRSAGLDGAWVDIAELRAAL